MGNDVDPSSTELLEMGNSIILKALAATSRMLCCIRFDTSEYLIYANPNENTTIKHGRLGELQDVLLNIAKKNAALAEIEALTTFLDLETVQNRLLSRQAIALSYLNFDGSVSDAQFIVAERQDDDVPAQILLSLKQSPIRALDDIASQIDRERFLDAVTGLLNRTGYERVKAETAHDEGPLAYVLVDVDNLKDINDSYGHAVGDDVLAQLADALRSIIRKGDIAARIGGDEFALILKKCPSSASKQIISKFELAHRMLSEALPDNKPVTLSVGVCFTASGLTDETTALADNAMYAIKADGRGGCALVDEDGNIFQRWFDGEIDRRRTASFANTVGSWRIEMPADGSPRRMFCDDSMLRIAGVKRRESPEEIYKRWHNGLPSADENKIAQIMDSLTEKSKLAHVPFSWTSEDGNVLPIVSSTAVNRDYTNGKCYYGYFDLTRSSDVRKRENEIEMLNEALARSLVFGYVLDLEKGSYTTLRRPASGPLSLIKLDGPTVSLINAIRRFVADDEGEEAIKNLLDRESMPSRLAGIDHVYCDFLSTGVQGWCRAKLYTFKAGGFDGLEKVILVGESIEVDNKRKHEQTPAELKAHTHAKSDRILVIDDDELNRVLLEDALSDDFEVTCASDGVEAYELIRKRPNYFAGIVTDLSMPNMGGEELLQKLEEDGISGEVPVVVVTAEDKAESENRCLTHGAIDFIRKPFHMPVARKRVCNVVDLFKLQNHLRVEVEHQTQELQEAYSELEEKSNWLREYAFRLADSSARMIESLGEIVEFRSVEAGTHVARVKQYTHALAEHMLETNPECGLTEDMVKLITDASPLHDVGKIAIPDAVLLKPGRLTDEEFECMKSHTTQGYHLLASLDSAWEDGYRAVCEEICLCHHERYDGTGYPNGLKGEEIPLSAQIVSVADVFDALSSDRVYRPALSREETRDLILSGKVGSFSDRILRCFEETYPQLEEIAEQIAAEGL